MKRRNSNSLFSAHDVLAALRSGIRILSWAMAALIALYLASGITVVAPNETGVILRFGKVVSSSHPPGLLFALPPPIDEVIKVPVKSVQETPLELWAAGGGDAEAALNPVSQPYTLTGDVNIIRASFVVRYQVSDPVAYALYASNRDALRDAVLYEAACHVLSTMSVEDTLTVGKNYIGVEALRLAQEKLNSLHLGIRLLAFETRDINPPGAVSAAFQSVVSAKVQARTLLDDANAYAASTIPGAKAEAYRVEQEADSYAQQVVAKAQGETAAFSSLLHEYLRNPGLVHARLQAEMLTTVMPKVKIATLLPNGGAGAKIFLNPQTAKAPLQPVGTDITEPQPAAPGY
jgi:membrane protease subunit HflK